MKRSIVALGGENTSRDVALKNVCNSFAENGAEPLIIIFSSGYDDFGYYSEGLKEKYPAAQIIGMTSHINFNNKGSSEGVLSALAVFEGVESRGGVLFDIGRCPIRHIGEVENALEGFSDKENVCCLEFTTALCRSEELILETFNRALSPYKISVFGGTAGVRNGTNLSRVSLNGKVYDEACVFLLIKNLRGHIAAIKEDLLKQTPYRFTATDVDFDNMTIVECDGRPAAPYIASLLGLSVPELAEELSVHPIGRIHDDEMYIAQPKELRHDGGVTFYSHIYNYTQFVLLEPCDIARMQERMTAKTAKLGFSPSFSVCVCCVLLTEDFNEEGNFGVFNDILKKHCGNYIGFSGWGEQMNFEPLQKTAVIVFFE